MHYILSLLKIAITALCKDQTEIQAVNSRTATTGWLNQWAELWFIYSMNQPDLWTGSTGSLKRTSSNKLIIHWSVFLSSTNWLSDPVTAVLELTPHWRGKWSVNNDFVLSLYSCVNIPPCVSQRKRTLEVVNNDRTIHLIQTWLQFSLRDTQRAKCADHTQVLGSRSEGDWTRAGGQGGSD